LEAEYSKNNVNIQPLLLTFGQSRKRLFGSKEVSIFPRYYEKRLLKNRRCSCKKWL